MCRCYFKTCTTSLQMLSLLQSNRLNTRWTPASYWLSIIVLCYSEPGLNAAGSSWYISVLLAWQFSAELCSLLPDTINLLFHIYSGIGHWAHVVIFLKLLTAGTSVFDSSPLMCFMWFILFIMFLELTAVNENKTTLSGGCKEMQCKENVAVLCYRL